MYRPGDFVKVRNKRHVVVRTCLKDSYVVKPVLDEEGRARETVPYTVHHLVIKPDKMGKGEPERNDSKPDPSHRR